MTGLRGSPVTNDRRWVRWLAPVCTALCALLTIGCSLARIQHLDTDGRVICEAKSAVVGTSESTIKCGEVAYTTRGGGMSETTAGALEKIAEGAARGAAEGLVP